MPISDEVYINMKLPLTSNVLIKIMLIITNNKFVLLFCSYVRGSPLLENVMPFESRQAAEKTAEALGRVLILDLVLRNEDRL